MTREISFYKKNKRWYAYLPEFIAIGGSEAECEMVRGADTLLDIIAGHRYDGKPIKFVTLKISDTENLGNKMIQVDSDDFGSSYIVIDYDTVSYNHFLWLCPVTLSVFDDYPEEIYFHVIERRASYNIKYEYPSLVKKIWHLAKIAPRFVKELIRRKLKRK